MAFFRRTFPNRWGILLLAAWLIASGVLALVPAVNFAASGTVLAVLAIASGVLILLDR